MAACGNDVRTAVALLKAGRCVALPTETVYGLAARADDPQAIEEIYRIKGRPSNNPLILHFDELSSMRGWVARMPEEAERLAKSFWPGPLTLLLPRGPKASPAVAANLPRVGVRVPAHPVFRKIIKSTGVPLAAPSANRSGYVSPTQAGHVANAYGEELAYVFDGGPCEVGIESTIVGWEEDGTWRLYRPGAIAATAIERVLDAPLTPIASGAAPVAPGMLPHHYAPHTPVAIGGFENAHASAREGWVTWRGLDLAIPPQTIHRPISTRNRLEDAARELYDAMIVLDGLGLECIRIQPFPHRGIGIALNERIQRASQRIPTP